MQGSAIIVYQDGDFKSFLTEIKPPFTDVQLKWMLAHIPANELMIAEQLVLKGKGKISIESLLNSSPEQKGAYATANEKITLFCALYFEKVGVSYKVSSADAGKIKQLGAKPEEWLNLLTTYFDSDNFLFKAKYSISNLVKYFNELRAEAFGDVKPIKKKYPIPYDHLVFVKLAPSEQQYYWQQLRDAGYVWDVNASRNGKWVKY